MTIPRPPGTLLLRHHMLDIFSYTNYRTFLQDLYAHKKSLNPRLTYGVIAKRAGFKSQGFLTQVFQGKTNLSPRMVLRFAEAFELTGKEKEFFEMLVFHNQSQSGKDKRFYLEKIRNTKGFRVQALQASQSEYYTHWYYSAIRALLETRSFREDQYAEMARMLVPSISPAEAGRTVTLLLRLGLIRLSADGTLELTEHFITGTAADPIIIDGFKIQMLDLAKEALDRMPGNVQNTSTLTLSISRNRYETYLAKIATLRRELLEMADQEEASDSVYQLNFSIFPLTRLPEQGL